MSSGGISGKTFTFLIKWCRYNLYGPFFHSPTLNDMKNHLCGSHHGRQEIEVGQVEQAERMPETLPFLLHETAVFL